MVFNSYLRVFYKPDDTRTSKVLSNWNNYNCRENSVLDCISGSTFLIFLGVFFNFCLKLYSGLELGITNAIRIGRDLKSL